MRVIPLEPGQRFERLTVLRVLPGSRHRPRTAECICDCGALATVSVSNLRRRTGSCGCRNRERSAERATERNLSHGLARHPLYDCWRNMLDRCESPADPGYANYGARGIQVCPEWHDVAAFAGWIEANLGPRPQGMTLDRINNDGNYEPGNLRWATHSEQARNQRPRRLMENRRDALTAERQER